jgi:hypothetical protein
MTQRVLFLFTLILLGLPNLCFAAGPAIPSPGAEEGSLAVWAIVELHFLGVMVIAGSSLLAFFIDAIGALLGRHLRIGDALWKSLFSRLSVVFSLLGLAALGVAGAYPESIQAWLGRYSPTFGVHMFFGILGLASGYGVLNSRGDGARVRDRQRSNGAIAVVSLILVVGFGATILQSTEFAHSFYVGSLAFLLPLVVLLSCRFFESAEGTRLSFEAIATLSFMILVGVASSWRGVAPHHTSLDTVFQLLTVRESVFHGVAALALVSLLELAWGQVGDSGGGTLGREFKRLGADDRWFLVAAVLSLTVLPFTGYFGSLEASEGSWLLAFQGGLAGLTLLALNHVLWARIERIRGPGATRTWLWALFFVFGLIVLVTPGEVPLMRSESIALAGQGNHPTFSLWGTAALKHLAFGLLAMASFDALLSMVRGEVLVSAHLARHQPRFRAGIWSVGALTIVFLLFGFGALKARSSNGSTWDLLKITTLEFDDAKNQAALNKSRPAALGACSQTKVPEVEPGNQIFERLVESNYVQIQAVQQSLALTRARANISPDKAARDALKAAATVFETATVSAAEWELLWFEALAKNSEKLVLTHIALLEQHIRIQSEAKVLSSKYGLSPADQTLLLWPLTLLILGLIAVTVSTWFMASNMGSWSRALELGFAFFSLAVLFIGAHKLHTGDWAVIDRFTRSQQILVMGLMGHLAGMQLVSVWCGTRLEIVKDPFVLAKDGSGEVLRKVEALAALSFIFLLVLGGWAQTGLGAFPGGEITPGSKSVDLLFLIKSIDGYPLGTAVKSAFVLGMGMIVFLSATRFFVSTQQSGENAENDGDGRITLREILPAGLLLLLLLLYLASESWFIACLFLGVLFLVVIARQDWRELPLLAVLFAFCFLFAGVECSKWDVTRRRPLIRPIQSAPIKAELGGK